MPKVIINHNWTQAEVDGAAEFIAEAMKAYIEATAIEKAYEVLERFSGTTVEKDDHFTVNFAITTIGNDLITALSAARRNPKIYNAIFEKEL